MKTRYNKSKIMRLAHHLMKYEGYTRSQALTLAWSKARRSDFYLIIEIVKPCNIEKEINMSYESINSYYGNGAYSGD
ncbi:hypothetical protein CLV62_12233 [Dysgonomonas alginatilytica]|uniref:Uncharacterized protein n=1 Tax=Dysgonomonas alginatilytica TaxID=1605892 RepID=A0A2V3PMI2_9BACT|nr:hypothetical protein [Dysgonomonas alginatilytica]PXV62080.1 hypothetical protein CLV62_12233 [Dysgonomonas alginatilytica]